MRVLAFRHVPFEGLGLIGPALESRGIAFDYADLYRDGPGSSETNETFNSHNVEHSDASAYDGLIFLGGPMSANDPLPYLGIEMRILERAIAAGRPVLGVCLGAQLIAKTLGAPVYRNAAPEIGWFDINFTEAARADPIFSGLNPVETVFHWHSDTFDLPAGAELLARSSRTERQAFRYGGLVYGLQFHLEVTAQMIVDWCEEDQNCGDMRELSALPHPVLLNPVVLNPVVLNPWTNRNRLDQVAQHVFGRWCDLISPLSR